MRLNLLLAALVLPLAMPASAALAPGAKAPDFTTRGAINGQVFRLHLKERLKKGPVVLYFFPKAFTGGCNAEAKAFADAVPDFAKAGATVIGMSADTVPDLQRFSTQHCAGKFGVASAGPNVIRSYDVMLKKPDGAETGISDRTSFVIAPNGTILLAHSDMNPAEHVAKTLAAVRAWKAKH